MQALRYKVVIHSNYYQLRCEHEVNTCVHVAAIFFTKTHIRICHKCTFQFSMCEYIVKILKVYQSIENSIQLFLVNEIEFIEIKSLFDTK